MVEWNNQFIQFHNLFYNLQITAAKKTLAYQTLLVYPK